jgi:integrase
MYQVRMTVPPPLREIAKRRYGAGCEFVRSLGTKDAKEAKRLAPAVVELFENRLKAAAAELAGQCVSLSDREIAALCGRWLAQQQDRNRDKLNGTAAEFEEAADALSDIARGLDGDPAYTGSPHKDAVEAMREDVDPLLAECGLNADADSRDRLSVRLLHLQRHWFRDLEARARTGRWVETVRPEDFPAASVGTKAAPAGCTFDALLAGWALDHGWQVGAKPVPRALYDRQRTLERFAAFVGHRDAGRVTKADVVRWKEDALGRGLTIPTVRNDISELSAVWAWGVANGKLAGGNPFTGTLPPKASKKARDPRPFTDAEAALILEAARRRRRGFLRWLPWVLCLTGARLNEVCQSVKEDVAVVDGVAVLRIHDEGEGRSVKNADSRRTVPLHPALIAEGFLDYVAALPAGSPLWPDVKPDAVFGQRGVTAGKRVARWVRTDLGILDPRVSPNHSWRHWFIDAARRVVMPVEVRSAITGHSGQMDESANYGAGMGAMVNVLAEWMTKVRCPVDAQAQEEPPRAVA